MYLVYSTNIVSTNIVEYIHWWILPRFHLSWQGSWQFCSSRGSNRVESEVQQLVGETPNFPLLISEEACPNSPWETLFHILEWEGLYQTFTPKHKGCTLVGPMGTLFFHETYVICSFTHKWKPKIRINLELVLVYDLNRWWSKLLLQLFSQLNVCPFWKPRNST